ncbi:TPA: histidine phosphatase family protein [Staphylococcus pseudintermedius]|nr:histidine phosphatase family protein [Staphylococcus pseudintermedius]EGQ3897851.1 histidine phosphatase family protein [Staphylococcus pseudintermedius]EHA6084731.1 histidine phosphatase family protein [Staphylococcus pseudintermedius]EJG0129783.1 histidine phosphatase family protein [Staphylococcus pseudintermedius]MDK3971656.1 histidine phosphatase family protein [Staphylococcus pseudintermedius]
MVKTIYFVRHATREHTVKSDTAPLSEKGRREAENLVKWFEGKHVDAIYASPYARTLETVVPLARVNNINIQVEDGLRERVIGEWVDDFDTYAAEQWMNFDYRLLGGESLKQVQKRIVSSFQDILSQEKGETIVISGHGTSLAVLFHTLTDGTFAYEQFKQMTMPDVYTYNVDTKVLKRTHLN